MNNGESVGYESAGYDKRIFSAAVDLIINIVLFVMFMYLINILFTQRIYLSAEKKINAANEQNNLIYRETVNDVVKDKLGIAFEKGQLEDIKTAEANYQTKNEELQSLVEGSEEYDDKIEEVNSAIITARYYCLEKDKRCDEVSIDDYTNLVSKPSQDIIFINMALPLLSGFFAAVITSFAIPMFDKNRQTIGRKIFKLGLVTNKGQTVPIIFLIARMMVGVIFEFAITVILFTPIVLIASILLMFCTKRRSTIKCFFSNTVVVDLEKQTEIVPRLDLV